ncbi:succinylglutamate desuccinylase/aspartoacylase family protein [Reinekea forsetii]|nr:succinylglutamate desuccinylase/aspartoacylase family protein [Reinekea forsetii]
MAFERIALPSQIPGQQTTVAVHRFGPSTGQKVYIQAGLHADEHPGLLVAQKLIEQLQYLEDQDKLLGQFIIVPFANPIGLKQRIFGHVNGRCDLGTGQNFNRGMSIDPSAINDEVLNTLCHDPRENDEKFRGWLKDQIDSRSADFEISSLHKLLLSLSIDSHFMLDLHCDVVALPHVFYGNHQPEDGQLLTRCMAANVALEEDVTGTVAFDGTHTQPWVLAQKQSNKALFSQPCFAATVELRGNTDVNLALANQDASGLLNFFKHKGLIQQAPEAIAAKPNKTIGVEQVKMLTAPGTGIITYNCELGDFVKGNQLIAKIVVLDQEKPTEIDVLAPCDGYVFSHTQHYFVSPGQTIAMLATDENQQSAGEQLAF